MRVEPRAVVAHQHLDRLGRVAHHDLDLRRLGVLGDLGQRLLDQAVDRRLEFGRGPGAVLDYALEHKLVEL